MIDPRQCDTTFYKASYSDCVHYISATIEIIPGDGSELLSAFVSSSPTYGPFLYVDDNLGVPQKILYKAYLTCVPLLARLRKMLRQSWEEIENLRTPPEWIDELKHVSAVILLGNPAHQTALNIRKRLVHIGFLRADRELGIAEAMLSVRDCSKQAIWWRYRRWLLRNAHSGLTCQIPAEPRSGGGVLAMVDVEDDSLHNVTIPSETIRYEFDVIARACELYPRNYYAWIHRYHCLQALDSLSQTSTQSLPYVDALREEFETMKTWIERHVSDYTAIHHICQVYESLRRHQDREHMNQIGLAMDTRVSSSESGMLFEHCISLLTAYPTHESLWLYLRSAVINGCDARHEADAILYARECLYRYLDTDVSCTGSDGMIRNACRLLAWFVRQVSAICNAHNQ